MLEKCFETYEAGSRIINVFSPGHGLVSGTTYRFRGPPTISRWFFSLQTQKFDGLQG